MISLNDNGPGALEDYVYFDIYELQQLEERSTADELHVERTLMNEYADFEAK